jgi:hypothetical protein
MRLGAPLDYISTSKGYTEKFVHHLKLVNEVHIIEREFPRLAEIRLWLEDLSHLNGPARSLK